MHNVAYRTTPITTVSKCCQVTALQFSCWCPVVTHHPPPTLHTPPTTNAAHTTHHQRCTHHPPTLHAPPTDATHTTHQRCTHHPPTLHTPPTTNAAHHPPTLHTPSTDATHTIHRRYTHTLHEHHLHSVDHKGAVGQGSYTCYLLPSCVWSVRCAECEVCGVRGVWSVRCGECEVCGVRGVWSVRCVECEAGDELLEVDGSPVEGAPHREVTETIGASTTVSLLLRRTGIIPVRERNGDPLMWRPVTRSPTGVSHTSATSSNLKSFTSHGVTPNSSKLNESLPNGFQKALPGRAPTKNGFSHTAPHPRGSTGAPPALSSSLPRSEGALLTKVSNGSPVHLLSGKSGPVLNGGMSPRGLSSSPGGRQHTQVPPGPRPTGEVVERLLRLVIAAAGKTSLGFSITHDKGVTVVATVRRGGAAWAAGLRQHDRIMACNGRPIASMTHEQAVAEMKRSQATITLEVRRVIKTEQITGESSGYNSSASSTTGDQASPTTTTTPRRRRPNIKVPRDPVSSKLRARQLELQRIEGHWAAAEEEEEEEQRRRRVSEAVLVIGILGGGDHSANDLLDAGLYFIHPSAGVLSASVSSLTAVGADSSADDHDSSGCEDHKMAVLTPSAGAHVSNIVVSSNEEDAICRLERLSVSGANEPQLQLVDLQLQRIREHQLLLARRERELLTEKTIYATQTCRRRGGGGREVGKVGEEGEEGEDQERRQLQLDRFSPHLPASVLAPSDSDTLYSHGPPSSASSSGSPPTSSCGKHTSRILIKSCPPPPPLRQENTVESPRDCPSLCSSDPQHTHPRLEGLHASCNCHESRDCVRHCCCRVTSSAATRNSPPSSPSSSSGVSCSSHTLQSSSSVTRSKSFDTLSSSHSENGHHIPHWDSSVNESKGSPCCSSCHRPSLTIHDCTHDKAYASSSSVQDRTYSSSTSVHDKTYSSPPSIYDKPHHPSSGQLQKSNIPAPPVPSGLPIIPRPPPLRMGDESSSTTSSSSGPSNASNASSSHRTNFSAALSDVVSKRNARLTEDSVLDDGARAEAYEAKIDAYKRENVSSAESKKLQHVMLMEEVKRKHQKMFEGEERSRPISPASSTTTTEIRYFGPGAAATAPQSDNIAPTIKPQSTIASSMSEPQSTIANSATRPQSTIINAATKPQSTTSSSTPRLKTTSISRPQNTIIIGSNVDLESSSTLPSSVRKSDPLPQQVKAVKNVEKEDQFGSKIVTRSVSSSVVTRPDTKRKVISTSSQQKDVLGGSGSGTNNDDDDSNSVRHFWKKQENASKAPATKPQGKAPVQATKSFSGLRAIDKTQPLPAETNGVFPVTLKKTSIEPTIVEDVNDDTDTPSTLQLIKTFNSIASSAPKKSVPTARPKSVILVTTNTSQTKVSDAPNGPKTTSSTTMKPVTSIDRTPRLVSQQVPSKYTIIPPPPSPLSDKSLKPSDSHRRQQVSSHTPSLPQSISSNTSKVYVSVNGDSIESSHYSSNNIINGVHSDSERHFSDLLFSEAYSASPLSSSANLNFSIRNVSPTELIIPEPPTSSADLCPEIPRGVPPPPPARGDSWSDRYERRVRMDEDDAEREVSSDYKNLFDYKNSKPLVSINSYKPS
ncbi:PDZ domain [Trinorchestia longiramus]|nr:PDZ domain [Trinorchestia longiramus]